MNTSSRSWFVGGVFLALVLVIAAFLLFNRYWAPSTNSTQNVNAAANAEPTQPDPLVTGSSLTLAEAIGKRALFYSVASGTSENPFGYVDGTSTTKGIFDFEGDNISGQLSPDGRRFAYLSRPSIQDLTNQSLWVRTFATGENRLVKNWPSEHGFDLVGWMPDGRGLLVGEAQVEHTLEGEIQNTNLLGTVLRAVDDETAEETVILDADMLPAISPFVIRFNTVAFSTNDSSLYAVIGNDPDGPPVGTLYRIDLQMKKIEVVADFSNEFLWPTILPNPWFQDRSRIVVGIAGQPAIKVLHLDDRALTVFPLSNAENPYSTISPDGQHILILRWSGDVDYENYRIPVDMLLVNLETGEEETIVQNVKTWPGSFTPGTLLWSPDSTFILFGLDTYFYRFDVQNKSLHRIVDATLNPINDVSSNEALYRAFTFYGWIEGPVK